MPGSVPAFQPTITLWVAKAVEQNKIQEATAIANPTCLGKFRLRNPASQLLIMLFCMEQESCHASPSRPTALPFAVPISLRIDALTPITTQVSAQHPARLVRIGTKCVGTTRPDGLDRFGAEFPDLHCGLPEEGQTQLAFCKNSAELFINA